MAFPITDAWLRARHLRGIDLTDDLGLDFGAPFFEHAIASALEWTKAELDLPISKVEGVKERHDYRMQDFAAWQFLTLDKRPIRQIKALRYVYGGTQVMEVPKDWVRLDNKNTGQVQLVPQAGSSAPLIAVAGGAVWMGPSMPWGHSTVPGWYEVEYDAGWDDDEIPSDVLEIVGTRAAWYVLNTAGDLIAGAGIASFSIGLDGISSSVNTTSSATNSGYGARILLYERQLQSMIPTVRARFAGVVTMEIG